MRSLKAKPTDMIYVPRPQADRVWPTKDAPGAAYSYVARALGGQVAEQKASLADAQEQVALLKHELGAVRAEANVRQRLAAEELATTILEAQGEVQTSQQQARLLELRYEAAQDEAVDAGRLRAYASGAVADRWEAERREAETRFEAAEQVSMMQSRVVRLQAGLEAVYRKQVQQISGQQTTNGLQTAHNNTTHTHTRTHTQFHHNTRSRKER